MIAALRLRPLLLPLCFFAAGIAVAGTGGFSLPEYALPLVVAIAGLLIIVPGGNLFPVAMAALLFVCGNLLLQPSLAPNPDKTVLLERSAGNLLLVEGVVVQRPEAREDGVRIMVRLEHVFSASEELPLDGLVLLRVGAGGRSYLSGDRVRFYGKLRAPRNFGIPAEFDAERYFALKGVVATSFVKSDAEILLVRQAVEAGFQRHFDAMAKKIGAFITARLPGPEGGVLKALLIGDAGDIPQELKDAYSRTGVNHILSISGFHVGIVAIGLFQFWFVVFRVFPRLLLYFNFRRSACLLSFPLILYYMLLSGSAPATARAVLMLGFLMIGLFLEQESDNLNSLILAAFILLMARPANMYDISFQLSFLALWGILALTPLLMSRFQGGAGKKWHGLLVFFAASLAAIAATFIPVACYFQQSSLTGLLSNFFIVPLLGYGAVISGFAAVPFIWLLPAVAGALLALAGLLVTASNAIIAQLDRLPLLPVFSPTPLDVTLFLGALLFISLSGNIRRKTMVMTVVPLLLVALHQVPAATGNFRLKIDFLSVGQGESSLITFADGKVMLIDGGGPLHDSGWDVGKRLLLPALRKIGVSRVDYLVLTHPHPDHLQGVLAVAENLPVGEFWETGIQGGDDYRRLKNALLVRNVPTRTISAASVPLELSGATVRFIHPLPGKDGPEQSLDVNDDSMVLRLETPGFSALFTGDIGCGAEKRLLERPEYLHATVLKVPHHGSRYSAYPAFYRAVSPEIALVGAGYNNSFGLPSAEVITALGKTGCRIYRTDLDGTISLSLPLNGKNLVISTLKRHFN